MSVPKCDTSGNPVEYSFSLFCQMFPELFSGYGLSGRVPNMINSVSFGAHNFLFFIFGYSDSST